MFSLRLLVLWCAASPFVALLAAGRLAGPRTRLAAVIDTPDGLLTVTLADGTRVAADPAGSDLAKGWRNARVVLDIENVQGRTVLVDGAGQVLVLGPPSRLAQPSTLNRHSTAMNVPSSTDAGTSPSR